MSRAHLARLIPRLGKRQAELEYGWMKRAAQAGSSVPLDEMVSRRVASEPLQYILGTQPFGSLSIKVRSPVLIPRPETEHWTIRLAELLRPTLDPARPLSVLDIGTGTGCIPLLLCRLLPPGTIRAHGIDISPAAVKLAEENASLCDFSEPASLTSPRNTFRPIQWSIRRHNFQPPLHTVTRMARQNLCGDGLDFYVEIAKFLQRTPGFLLPKTGILALEVGDGQADSVQTIFREIAQLKSEVWLDPWDKKRTVIARAE
ncbi:PrmC-N domain-containing protein [Mycena sanguinolenta]|uniref:PrmC-N domain-containing protein n=1 Tax=Mycena sanguinolenta TaxID=230812 RepID=A0A8H6ZFA8_9AGAR|nr:PrmC-N domain-containing protein [Mycena sanguinolenta]